MILDNEFSKMMKEVVSHGFLLTTENYVNENWVKIRKASVGRCLGGGEFNTGTSPLWSGYNHRPAMYDMSYVLICTL
jgi:hypothetical protein